MTKFIFHIHQHSTIRRFMGMGMTMVMVMVMVVVVGMFFLAAQRQCNE